MKSRIDRMFSSGAQTESRREAIVAHCIAKRVDPSKEVIHGCFARTPERNITISIHPSTRADMNTHNRFRGNLLDRFAAQAMPAGMHFLAEGLMVNGDNSFTARWINLIPHPGKLHKGIVTCSRARFPGSSKYEMTLLPFSYQIWADKGILVTPQALQQVADHIQQQHDRWMAHEQRRQQQSGYHPLAWTGIRFRALNEHGTIVAVSPTLFGLHNERLNKISPPTQEDVLHLHALFAEKAADQHGDVIIEAMPFQEFYTSMHIKRPNHFVMPILLDGRAQLGIKDVNGNVLLDEESARFMAVERGFLRLSHQGRGNSQGDEGYVEEFFGYGMLPVHTLVRTHDDQVAKLQETVMPAEVNIEHTDYWLNQVRNNPVRYDSETVRYLQTHPYQDLPVHEAMMDRIKQHDDRAYRFYEMTNKAIRMSGHAQTVEMLEDLDRYFNQGNKSMTHLRAYYQAAQPLAQRDGNLQNYNASLVQLWREYAGNQFQAPEHWGTRTTKPAPTNSYQQPPTDEPHHPALSADQQTSQSQAQRAKPRPTSKLQTDTTTTTPAAPSADYAEPEFKGQRMRGRMAPGQG